MTSLRELIEDEIAAIPTYSKFWYDTAFSTTKLNPTQVQDAIQKIYAIFGLIPPRIHFCDSLYVLIKKSIDLFNHPPQYYCEDGSVFATQIMAQIHELQAGFFENIGHWDLALTSQLSVVDGESIDRRISHCLQQTLLENQPDQFKRCELHTFWVLPRLWYADEASPLDFHFSAVRRQMLFKAHDDVVWQAYRQLILSCSWLTAFESDCLICERPVAFSLKTNSTFPTSILFANGDELVLQNNDEVL